MIVYHKILLCNVMQAPQRMRAASRELRMELMVTAVQPVTVPAGIKYQVFQFRQSLISSLSFSLAGKTVLQRKQLPPFGHRTDSGYKIKILASPLMHKCTNLYVILDCVCPGAGLEQGGGLRLHKQCPAQDRDPAKLPENQGLFPNT